MPYYCFRINSGCSVLPFPPLYFLFLLCISGLYIQCRRNVLFSKQSLVWLNEKEGCKKTLDIHLYQFTDVCLKNYILIETEEIKDVHFTYNYTYCLYLFGLFLGGKNKDWRCLKTKCRGKCLDISEMS
jgi:hypothetical protein